MIQDNETFIEPGDGTVTMQQIAERCGVHRSTVQRALAGSDRVKPETAVLVRQVAEEMGYDFIVHHNARRLAWRKHGKHFINRSIVLFFPPDFSRHNYFLQMFQGMLDILAPAQYDLLTTYRGDGDEIPLPYSVLCGNVDGAIAIGDDLALTSLRRCLHATANFGIRPLISLLLPVAGYSAILTDDRGGSYQAAAHLLDLGHRYLLHFWENAKSREPEFYCEQRMNGYRQAYRERGLDPDRYLIGTTVDYDLPREDWSVRPMFEALERHPEVTGILAQNDLFATEVYAALRHAGRRVPDEISVIGFDDSDHPIYDAHGRNILTTIRLPLEEVGREAARLIIRQVDGENTTPTAIILPATLVIRGTTCPAPK